MWPSTARARTPYALIAGTKTTSERTVQKRTKHEPVSLATKGVKNATRQGRTGRTGGTAKPTGLCCNVKLIEQIMDPTQYR